MTVRLHNERAEVRAEVLDNGGGFNPDAVSTGHGLATMRERIEAVGGRLDLQSSGDGTAVKAVVPRFSHI